MNSISIRTDSLQPVDDSDSMEDDAESDSEGDGDADELGVDDADCCLIVSSTSRSSYKTQMEPFSPIRYDTSRGSIHIVNSEGKSVCKNWPGNPTKVPAWASTGSILPFMRIQR